MYILEGVRTKTNRTRKEIIVSKFTLENFEAEPTTDGKLWIRKLSSNRETLTPTEAKALAKYLNSWAGFEEAGTFSSGITIQGFEEEKIRRAVDKHFKKVHTAR
jgi:hypothetical protein